MQKQRKLLVIHCSASKPSQDWGYADIRLIHVDQLGWDDVAYNKIIKRDGTVQRGRPDHKKSAAQAPWNLNTLAVCLIGGIDEEDTPDDNFTAAQFIALKAVVQDYRKAYDIVTICGHRDLPRTRHSDARVAKACPCFHVLGWIYTEIICK